MAELIMNPEALALARRFVKEREKVRRARLAGEPKPWTDWPVLQHYKFTNIRHRYDYVTDWLVNNWYNQPDYLHTPNIIVAAAAARLINWPESLEEIGFPTDLDSFPDRVEFVLLDRQARGEKIHSAAYLIRGFEGEYKGTSIAKRWIKPMCVRPPLLTTQTMKGQHAVIAGQYAGTGDFIAGQMVVDLTYVVPGEWADRYIWAPQGPGSTRFLAALFGDTPTIRRNGKYKFNKNMMEDEFHTRLNLFKAEILKDPEVAQISAETGMIHHDWQNVCCESFKLWRYFVLKQAPKARYPGV